MIEDYEANIDDLISKLEDSIKAYDLCRPSEKQDHSNRISAQFKAIKDELELFSSEIMTVDYSEKKIYQTIHSRQDNHLKNIKNSWELKIMQSGGEDINAQLEDIAKMSQADAQKKAIDHGDKLLKAQRNRALDILFTVNQANIMAEDIKNEIREQNQRMLDMEEIIKDSQSALKRVNELVGFFAKAFYRDLVLKILIVLIAIAIIGVVIASMAKKKAMKSTTVNTQNNTTPVTPVVTRLLQGQHNNQHNWYRLDKFLDETGQRKPLVRPKHKERLFVAE